MELAVKSARTYLEQKYKISQYHWQFAEWKEVSMRRIAIFMSLFTFSVLANAGSEPQNCVATLMKSNVAIDHEDIALACSPCAGTKSPQQYLYCVSSVRSRGFLDFSQAPKVCVGVSVATEIDACLESVKSLGLDPKQAMIACKPTTACR
jgi:hypothetical protein